MFSVLLVGCGAGTSRWTAGPRTSPPPACSEDHLHARLGGCELVWADSGEFRSMVTHPRPSEAYSSSQIGFRRRSTVCVTNAAACGRNGARCRSCRRWGQRNLGGGYVNDGVAALDDVNDVGAIKGAPVGRLSAGVGVESGDVGDDLVERRWRGIAGRRLALQHFAGELHQERVRVIQPLCGHELNSPPHVRRGAAIAAH